MKAWVLHDIGDIRLEDVAEPSPQPHEVCVRVRAAGICGSDVPRVYETGAHRMPLIPGHEFSGEVIGVGWEVPDHWLGKRVGVFPLIPCGHCHPCEIGHPETCRDYDYVGSRRDGAFAEMVAVPAANLIELPEAVSFEQGAMLEPMAVAAHALRRATQDAHAGWERDAAVAVCGLGTIGLLLTMLLVETGFQRIYVIGNRDTQKRRAMMLGILEDHFCNSRTEDVPAWLLEQTGGVELYFECVGRKECLGYGMESVQPFGRLMLIGNPASDMSLPRDTYWKILRNQLTVMGSWNSTFLGGDRPESGPDDWQYIVERLAQGRLAPEQLISHRLPLSGLEQGLHVMRDKSEDYCKVMVTV